MLPAAAAAVEEGAVHREAAGDRLESAGLLLGYGMTEHKVSAGGDSATDTIDGFVVAGEFGFEIAVDHIVVPIWLRPTYRPWSEEAEGAGTTTAETEVSDFVLGFGTGILGYF